MHVWTRIGDGLGRINCDRINRLCTAFYTELQICVYDSVRMICRDDNVMIHGRYHAFNVLLGNLYTPDASAKEVVRLTVRNFERDLPK